MIKKFESQFNGTKEMSEKHFIDPEILSSFLKENIPNFSGQLEIQEFIGWLIIGIGILLCHYMMNLLLR